MCVCVCVCARVLGLGRYIDSGSILRFSECIAIPLESILGLDLTADGALI